jgi:ribosomal protein S1
MNSSLPQLSLSDIQPKMELNGIVRKIELIGAFVDVGLEQEALLHISHLKAGGVNNVHDVLSEGQEVVVWVHAVDRDKGRVSLTMLKPPAVSWEELAPGQIHSGKVVRIEKFGVFVDIGAERPGLVHVSELAPEYVSAPGDIVAKGQEVQVKVLDVNPQRSKINLSIKALAGNAENELQQEEDEEEVPTAMALALQRAFSDSSKGTMGKSEQRSSSRQRAQQDAILRRTLEQHSES